VVSRAPQYLSKILENLFPIAKSVKERRHGPDVERMRAQPELMACEPIQLSEN